MNPAVSVSTSDQSSLIEQHYVKPATSTSLNDILSLVAKNTQNSVVITDAARKIIWVNKAFTKNTGYKLKEVQGKVAGHILQGKETNPATVKYMRKQLNGQLPFECEILNYTKKGQKLWYHIHVQPVFDKNNRLVYYVGMASNITRQKELEEIVLQQQESERIHLLQTTIEAQEKERNTLGSELHDNINQMLGVVVLYNGMIRTEPGNQELVLKQAEIIQNCITEIRTLSHNLVTPSLRRKFEDEIRLLVNNTLPSHYYKVRTRFVGEAIKKLSTDVQLHLYRIVQEQLNNILKHAAGNEVSVIFKTSEEALLLSVQDNGIGTNASEAAHGIGLQNITNRAKLINAEMSIKTAPGKGFKMVLKVPLNS